MYISIGRTKKKITNRTTAGVSGICGEKAIRPRPSQRLWTGLPTIGITHPTPFPLPRYQTPSWHSILHVFTRLRTVTGSMTANKYKFTFLNIVVSLSPTWSQPVSTQIYPLDSQVPSLPINPSFLQFVFQHHGSQRHLRLGIQLPRKPQP